MDFIVVISFILFSAIISTLYYYFLHLKTRMNIRFLYIDNIIVSICSGLISYFVFDFLTLGLLSVLRILYSLTVMGGLILSLSLGITMFRFWRTPKRMIRAKKNEIVSPADGNVIYIKHIDKNETPISIKNGTLNSIYEITKTNLLEKPCWLIGINMTPWDVHKNCTPIDGKVILNVHTKGKFLSLKSFNSTIENERNTYVIENGEMKVGIVQIASKRVRRIDSYVKEGEEVKRGDWLGMIRFGSQVDIIIPNDCKLKIELGQQIFVGKTIIPTF